MKCPGGYDVNGCEHGDLCHKANLSSAFYESCLHRCPVTCHSEFQTPCPETYDINGCPNEPTCACFEGKCPVNEYEQYTGCPMVQRVCEDSDKMPCLGEEVTKTYTDSDDREDVMCPGPITCVDKMMSGDHSHCQNLCPPKCDEVINNICLSKDIIIGMELG